MFLVIILHEFVSILLVSAIKIILMHFFSVYFTCVFQLDCMQLQRVESLFVRDDWFVGQIFLENVTAHPDKVVYLVCLSFFYNTMPQTKQSALFF